MTKHSSRWCWCTQDFSWGYKLPSRLQKLLSWLQLQALSVLQLQALGVLQGCWSTTTGATGGCWSCPAASTTTTSSWLLPTPSWSRHPFGTSCRSPTGLLCTSDHFRSLRPFPFVSLATIEPSRVVLLVAAVMASSNAADIAVDTPAVCTGVHVSIGNTVMLCPSAQLPIDLCRVCLSRCTESHQPIYCGRSAPDSSSSYTLKGCPEEHGWSRRLLLLIV